MHIALAAALLCAAAEPQPPEPAQPAAQAEASATRGGRKKPGKPPMEGVLNVNRASEAELRLLNGIGKKRAQLIIERRDKKPFASLDELGRMKGMRGVVRKNRSHLTVQGDTTLHPLTIASERR